MSHISLEQAEKKWGIKQKTIMKYVANGVINGIKVCNNRIVFPDINKPHYLGDNSRDIYKEIIKSVCNKEFFDYLLAYKDKDEFSKMVKKLIEKEYLLDVNNMDNHSTNIGLILGVNGKRFMEKPKRPLNINLFKVGLI